MYRRLHGFSINNPSKFYCWSSRNVLLYCGRLCVNGKLVGEDRVPITTERSFNAETIAFTAAYPLTIAIDAKDFKETDSGIEYSGLANRQVGDGRLIAPITDDAAGKVVAVASGEWHALLRFTTAG